MPIDIETVERESEFSSERTNAERILSFLLPNDDRTFRNEEGSLCA